MFSKGFHRIPAISLVVCVCVLVSFRGCTEVPGDGNAGDSGEAIADAGEDQTVLENALVVLDGSSSFDPDGQDLSFQWSLVSGPLITFVGSGTSHPTFVAPSLGHNLTLELKLEVGNGLATAEDTTTIHVVQIEAELPSRMCDDPDLPPHPFVEFIVEPVDGPGPLTIDCTAITSDGSELLSGTNVLYTWIVDGEADSGPMETHANKSFVLSSSGAHTVTLCLTISGLSWGCLDAQNAGQRERTVFVWPRISGVVHDGTEGIPGVVVAANNVPGGATDVTDSQGRYELSVSPGWSGVITPYHVNYDFQPASLEQVETTTSVSSQDFVASSSGSTDNGVYGPEDLFELLGSWGPCEGCPYDLNGDDEIDEEDLAILLANWGGLDDGSVPDPSDPLEQCSSELDCDDGNFCNGPETCVDSVCRAGLVPCPAQVCDEAGEACVDCLADSDCDDGRFCNGAEDCVSGLCEAGSNPCSGQLCDEDTDSCFDQACSVDADCDDNLFCNGTETCVNGLCTSDSAPCVGQQCDEDSATCVECLVDADCDDGVFCNGAETCQANSCVPGADPCPGQMCDGLGDVCADCLRNSDCDDGVYCNGAERCQSGSCVDGTVPCSGQSCDENTDSCTCSSDADCDDGLYCNGSETCVASSCTTGSSPCAAGEICDETTDQCTTVAGNIYYVATNDPNAGDSNPGTEALPFKTIQAAADIVDPGDTVLVKAGIYRESVTIRASGTPELRIVFRNFENDAVTIDAENIRGFSIAVGVVLNPPGPGTGDYVTIDGFICKNPSKLAQWGSHINVFWTKSTIIRNCEVFRDDYPGFPETIPPEFQTKGIVVTGPSEDTILEYNHIHHTGGNGGIRIVADGVTGAPTRAIVRWNHVHHVNMTDEVGQNNAPGIALTNGSTQCLAEHNVVHHCDDVCVGTNGSSGHILRYNICYLIDHLDNAGNGAGIKIKPVPFDPTVPPDIVMYNVAFLNNENGLEVNWSDGTGNPIVMNNTCYGNGARGITASVLDDPARAIILKNNISVNNVGQDLRYNTTLAGFSDFNRIEDGQFDIVVSPHSTSGDPASPFVNVALLAVDANGDGTPDAFDDLNDQNSFFVDTEAAIVFAKQQVANIFGLQGPDAIDRGTDLGLTASCFDDVGCYGSICDTAAGFCEELTDIVGNRTCNDPGTIDPWNEPVNTGLHDLGAVEFAAPCP